jgi:hypothetical protein
MAPRMRFVQSLRIGEILELMLPKKPVFKTGAVIRAWLPRHFSFFFHLEFLLSFMEWSLVR